MRTKKQTMTEKEFIAAFERAGFNFNVWGYEGVLNQISSLYFRYAEETKSKVLKELYSKRANVLHDILEQRGAYNF